MRGSSHRLTELRLRAYLHPKSKLGTTTPGAPPMVNRVRLRWSEVLRHHGVCRCGRSRTQRHTRRAGCGSSHGVWSIRDAYVVNAPHTRRPAGLGCPTLPSGTPIWNAAGICPCPVTCRCHAPGHRPANVPSREPHPNETRSTTLTEPYGRTGDYGSGSARSAQETGARSLRPRTLTHERPGGSWIQGAAR